MSAADVAFPGPYPTAETAEYWRGAADGRLSIVGCNDCGHRFLYPRMVCPRCWGEHLDWIGAQGTGVVVAITVVHRPAHPAFAELVPYVCAVVRLREGPTLMTNLVGTPVDSAVNQAVTVGFIRRGGWTLPVAALTSTPSEQKEV